MQRPLIPVVLFYIAGILLARFAAPLALLFAIAFALALLALFLQRCRKFFLCALLVMLGWVNLAHRTAILSPNDLRTIIGPRDAIVTIQGVLNETPYRRVHSSRKGDEWNTTARLDLSALSENNVGWRPAYGRVICHMQGLLPDTIFAGQTVEITGVVQPMRGPIADGLFDYRNFLSHQGIYYELNVGQPTDWRIISSPPKPPLADRFCAWARKSLALGLPVEDESLRLEWALTLGWKAALTDEVAEPFIKAATYHIFAVDGLRIAIICGILFTVLRVARVPRAYCGLMAVPLLAFYAAMTGWPASAIRAIVMITIIFGGWMLKRPSDFINSLFAAALLILLWEPRELFQAGFQLSFFVVLCIFLVWPVFDAFAKRLLRSDPLRPDALQSQGEILLRTGARYVLDLFFSSVAAWLGSIPLVAWYFHIITPLSGLANVLAVPLCVLVLISNLASLLLVSWLPFVAVLFNHDGWFFMECIRVTSQWSANWRGAYFYVPMPSLLTIAVYYYLLITIFSGWLWQGPARKWKFGGTILLIAIWCAVEAWQFPVTQLTILPLNGGHAVYVRPPGGWNDWLIDCGNEDEVGNVTKPFLEAQGINRVSHFVVTHGEISFAGGAESIIHLFNPRNIYASPLHFRSPDYRRFTADEKNLPSWRSPIKAGDILGSWTVLYPGEQTTLTKASDNALVLRGEFNGLRVLLLSDLSHAGENALMNTTQDLRANIVVAGLSGEAEPLSDALLNAVQPKVIVVADSMTPPNRKASERLKERLERRNTKIFYTSASDAVTVSIRNENWDVKAMDGTEISGAIPSSK